MEQHALFSETPVSVPARPVRVRRVPVCHHTFIDSIVPGVMICSKCGDSEKPSSLFSSHADQEMLEHQWTLLLSDERYQSFAAALYRQVIFLKRRLSEVPTTGDKKAQQAMEANVAVESVLRALSVLLPAEVQVLVMQLIDLRTAIVLRDIREGYGQASLSFA